MIFFGDDRYHLAVSPVFCILAASAVRNADARREPGAASGRPEPAPS
jgi:hypothetical protein